jgi:hypothetical protein
MNLLQISFIPSTLQYSRYPIVSPNSVHFSAFWQVSHQADMKLIREIFANLLHRKASGILVLLIFFITRKSCKL